MLWKWWTTRRINQRLSYRERLTHDTWLELFDPEAQEVAAFVLTAFSRYTKLDLLRARPDDELTALGFPSVAFSDWEYDLIQDFEQQFGTVVHLRELPPTVRTIRDWVSYLSVARGRPVRK